MEPYSPKPTTKMRLLTENLMDRSEALNSRRPQPAERTWARKPHGLLPFPVLGAGEPPGWGLLGRQQEAAFQAYASLPITQRSPPPAPPSLATGLSQCPPDAVTRAAVAPATLHLLEAVDAALLAAEAAARPVDEVHSRLRVHGEVQEEADHLPVHEDARLRGSCGHRMGGSAGRGLA